MMTCQRRDVRIEDGTERAGIAFVYRLLYRAAITQLFF